MQLRGDLFRNKKGLWVESTHLNWNNLPARVEAVIARRFAFLPDECLQLMDTACIEGDQFSAEILSRVLGKDEQKVQNLINQVICKQHQLANAQGIKQIGEMRLSTYQFRHSLFQIYLENHLNVLEKEHLHGLYGIELEKVYLENIDKFPEIIHTLARHFETGAMPEKAAQYYTRAGKYALRLSANHEAIAHFYRALQLLNTLPDSPERDHKELDLQLSIGPPLTAVKGWAPPEMDTAYKRAQTLCYKIDDPVRLIPALWLLATFRLGQSEHAEVDKLVDRLYSLALKVGNPALLSLARLQVSPFYQGRINVAKNLLEKAAIAPDLDQQRFLAQHYGMAPSIVAKAYLGNCLFLAGFPHQADQVILEACQLAGSVDHPMTSCYVISRLCWQKAMESNSAAALEQAKKLLQVSQKYGFKNFEYAAVFFINWAGVIHGDLKTDGINQMSQAMEAYFITKTVLNRSAFLVFFGQACVKTNQVDLGLTSVEESIVLGIETGEQWYTAEAYRIKGELYLIQSENFSNQMCNLLRAEECFHEALQIAR
jgi:predicted ATPase